MEVNNTKEEGVRLQPNDELDEKIRQIDEKIHQIHLTRAMSVEEKRRRGPHNDRDSSSLRDWPMSTLTYV